MTEGRASGKPGVAIVGVDGFTLLNQHWTFELVRALGFMAAISVPEDRPGNHRRKPKTWRSKQYGCQKFLTVGGLL